MNRPAAQPGPGLDLFVFHFAGGNRYSLKSLEKCLPPRIRPVFLEAPGRGGRNAEPLLSDIEALADDHYAQITVTPGKPFAFYGHSMGAYISYLVARRLADEKKTLPLRLFVSGNGGPASKRDRTLSDRPDGEFIDALKAYGGAPDEFYRSAELVSYFLPILRADFRTVENYRYVKPASRLPVPVTVMTGKEEGFTDAELATWQDETEIPVDFRRFSGNHFFIFRHFREIGAIIDESLQE